MEIKQIQNQNFAPTWDDFVIKNSSPSSFLQSWKWGEFKKKNQESGIRNQENNIFRFGIFDNNELVAMAQFFKIALPRGKFYFNCPRGPIIKIKNQKLKTCPERSRRIKNNVFDLFKEKINEIAEQEKIIFFRIAPPFVTQAFRPDWPEIKLKVTKPKILTNLIEPKDTLILDLEKSEEELLKNMHHKTRYNIRLAEKKEVRVTSYELRVTNKEVNIFYKLLQETAKRDKINIFNKEYYNKLLRVTDYGLRVTLFIAEYNNTPLSATIVIGFGNTATYLYGASSDKHRELMPNYLTQWRAIQWAKQQGYKYYDFWGISKQKEKWTGITRFKQGFVSNKTGEEINYFGAFDYILNKKWYNIYKVGKFIHTYFI